MKKGEIMSDELKKKISLGNLGKLRSEETKKKISLAGRGRITSEETKQKIRLGNLGKIQSENSKIKLSLSRKGIIFTEEHLKNLSKSHKGQIPWNKDLTKEDPRVKKYVDKLIGRKVSEETRKIIGNRTRNKTYEEIHGEEKAIEIKKIIGKKSIESWNKSPKRKAVTIRMGLLNKGKKRSEETRRKLKERRKYQVMPVIDTKIEKKIQSFLTELQIEYFTHKYMHIEHGYQCDIFIPSKNLIIECDGDYWHGNPLRNKELKEWQIARRITDETRTKELQAKGYKVVRLWGSDINQMVLNDLKEVIK